VERNNVIKNKYQRTLSDAYQNVEDVSDKRIVCSKCGQTKTQMFVCGKCLEIYESNHELEIKQFLKRIKELEDLLDIKNDERWT
jgi:hypothetical protein